MSEAPATTPEAMTITQASAKLAESWSGQEDQGPLIPRRERAANQPQEAAPAKPEAPQPESAPEPETEPEDDALLEAARAETETETETEDEQLPELPERLSLDDVAADYGLDKNELMQRVRHSVKVGDEERDVGLHELVMGYQRGKEHETAMAALERKRAETEAEAEKKLQFLTAAETQLQATANVVESTFQQEEQSIHARYQHVDWAALRIQDPGEYSARWTEYQSSLQNAAARKQGAWNELQTSAQTLVQAKQQQQAETLEKNRKELLRLMPDWSNPETFQKESVELTSYLKEAFSATDEEIAGITDPRVLVMADKAKRYDRMLAKANAAKVKQTTAETPKQAAPGRTLSPKAVRRRSSRNKYAQARERLKQSGKAEDAVEAFKLMYGETP